MTDTGHANKTWQKPSVRVCSGARLGLALASQRFFAGFSPLPLRRSTTDILRPLSSGTSDEQRATQEIESLTSLVA